MARPRSALPWTDLRNGIWYVCWYDPNARRTERTSLRTSDPAEAQTRFAAFLTQGAGTLIRTQATGLTVSKALDDYLREHVHEKVVDKTRQENAVRHLKQFFKNDELKGVDIPACRSYAAARRSGQVGTGRGRRDPNRPDDPAKQSGSDSTIRRELIVLAAASEHARKWNRISQQDLPKFEFPRETSAGEAEWLTRDELAKAIRLAPRGSRLRSFIRLAYWTGSRRHAIESLTKRQVDLKNRRINLAKPGEVKTKKRRPIVPLYPQVRRLLQRMVAESETDFVFGSEVDVYREFNRHMKAIGLGEKANPHILRHSRASHLLQAGVSIYDVARLLGDTVATVERVYGHHSAEYLDQTTRRR